VEVVAMKKAPFIILALLLVVAVLLGAYFFKKHEQKMAELAKRDDTISELNKTVADLNEKLDQSERRMAEKTEALETLQKQVSRFTEIEEVIKEKDQKIHQLQQALDTREADYQQGEANYQKALNELDDTKSRIALMQATLDTQQADYRQLEANHQKTQAALDEANSRIAQMQEKHAAGMQVLSQKTNELQKDLQDRLNESIRQLKEKQDGIQKLEASVEALKADLQAAADKYQQARNDNNALRSENNALKENLAKLDSKLTSVESKFSAEKDERERLENRAQQVKETYEKLLFELRDEVENKEAAIQQVKEKLSVTFIDKILFDFGQASISPAGQKRLLKVGGIISEIKNGKIRIQGHTDNIPIAANYRYKYPSNWELSAARAASVARFLIDSSGLKGENMEAVGFSYFKPIASNETQEGRSQNRRVEIVIAPEFD